MAKQTPAVQFNIGSTVVFNALPDATVFAVTGLQGPHGRIVRELYRQNFKEELMDVSLCRVPTAEQLKNHHTNVYGHQLTERELNYLHGV